MEPIASGTRIEKTNSKDGDTHPDGALGRIKEAIGPAADGTWGYFVFWDTHPDVPVFIAGSRIRVAPAFD